MNPRRKHRSTYLLTLRKFDSDKVQLKCIALFNLTSGFLTAEFRRVHAEFHRAFKLGHLRWQRVLRGRIEQQFLRKNQISIVPERSPPQVANSLKLKKLRETLRALCETLRFKPV
jgi:hypothetical protein